MTASGQAVFSIAALRELHERSKQAQEDLRARRITQTQYRHITTERTVAVLRALPALLELADATHLFIKATERGQITISSYPALCQALARFDFGDPESLDSVRTERTKNPLSAGGKPSES